MRNMALLLVCALPFIAGCAAVMSTTNTVARALEQITAVTSESTGPADDAGYADARRFVASQFVLVRREAATGGGDHTRALARLMDEPDPMAFGLWMQDHYQELFTGLTTHEELVARIAARRVHSGAANDA